MRKKMTKSEKKVKKVMREFKKGELPISDCNCFIRGWQIKTKEIKWKN
jgi:hypothetical protein